MTVTKTIVSWSWIRFQQEVKHSGAGLNSTTETTPHRHLRQGSHCNRFVFFRSARRCSLKEHETRPQQKQQEALLDAAIQNSVWSRIVDLKYPQRFIILSSNSYNTMDGRTVKLVSRDDVEFVLPLEAAKESRFVANSLSLDDDSPEENESDLRVDVIRVSGGCLEKVVDFLTHYKEEPMAEITMPLPGPTFEDVSVF